MVKLVIISFIVLRYAMEQAYMSVICVGLSVNGELGNSVVSEKFSRESGLYFILQAH